MKQLPSVDVGLLTHACALLRAQLRLVRGRAPARTAAANCSGSQVDLPGIHVSTRAPHSPASIPHGACWGLLPTAHAPP